MAENILDSYFVRIAALPDTKSFTRAALLLTKTELSLANVAKTATKSILAFETASISALAAIGIGLVSLADKTAMTDQSYRLMGMRMLMTKDSARAMQMALDELGATIDEVAFDPELNQRFQYLYEQNIRLGKQLGGDYDKIQRNIRDIRMEYKRFGTELEFLSYGVVTQLFNKLGFGNGDLLSSLDNLNEWFTENLPEWTNKITNFLIPAWNDSKIAVMDFGSLLKQAGGDFSYLTGLLMNDDSLSSTQFTIENLAKATQDWVDWITKAVLGIQLLAKGGGHSVASLASYAKEFYENMSAFLSGSNDYSAGSMYGKVASSEGKAAFGDFASLFNSDRWKNNPDASGLQEFYSSLDSRYSVQHGSLTSASLASLLDNNAKRYNVNPELLAAIMHQESGGNPGAKSGKGAMGLMQLMPETASTYGVRNPYNPEQNMDAGAHYFSDLLKRYNYNVPLALSAYNAGPGAVDRAGGVPQNSETPNYVSRILRNFIDLSSASQAAGGQVIVDTVNIHVPHSLHEDKWTGFVRDSFKEQTDKSARNTMAETAGGAYF